MENEVIQISCTACGGKLEPCLAGVRDPLTNELFAISKCTECGLGHTLPQPQDLERYYGERYYGNRHGLTLRHCVRRRLGFVAAAMPTEKAGKLLDIGCGDGTFLLSAKAAGWEVMGTELNPQPARSRGLDVKGAVEQIEVSERFDCITMWHTLEHMRDIPAMLSQLVRLLKPQGRLIIAVPDFGGLQARLFKGRWLHADVPRHLYHFDAGSLQYCLGASGLSVRRRWHQELEYDLLGWSQSALNFILPEPNVFFDVLTGKKGKAGSLVRCVALLLGVLLSLVSLPLLPLGSLMGRGGSLIVVAEKRKSRQDTHE